MHLVLWCFMQWVHVSQSEEVMSLKIVCSDLEGVLVPEVWISVAQATGIEALKLTTRDIEDYDQLMQYRLEHLRKHRLSLADIVKVIESLKPLPGALEFLSWLRSEFQVVILSDTFYEFAAPLMRQLGYPTLLCHRLKVDADGFIEDYIIRQKQPKKKAVKAFQQLNYTVLAMGDSFNDIDMLKEADRGFFIHAPESIRAQFPEFTSTCNYQELKRALVQVHC